MRELRRGDREHNDNRDRCAEDGDDRAREKTLHGRCASRARAGHRRGNAAPGGRLGRVVGVTSSSSSTSRPGVNCRWWTVRVSGSSRVPSSPGVPGPSSLARSSSCAPESTTGPDRSTVAAQPRLARRRGSPCPRPAARGGSRPRLRPPAPARRCRRRRRAAPWSTCPAEKRRRFRALASAAARSRRAFRRASALAVEHADDRMHGEVETSRRPRHGDVDLIVDVRHREGRGTLHPRGPQGLFVQVCRNQQRHGRARIAVQHGDRGAVLVPSSRQYDS